MGTIRFIIKYDKKDKKGLAPIDLIYQLHGQRKFYRTGKKMLPANWNQGRQDDQKAIYLDKLSAKKAWREDPLKKEGSVFDYTLFLSSKEVKDINTDLNDLQKDIRGYETRFEMDLITYSSQMVIDKLNSEKGPTTKREVHSDVILDYIDKYIRDHAATRVKGSLSVYKSLKAHLSAMIKAKKINVTFENIDHRFLQDFQNFLIEKRNLSNVTVAKQISTLKTFLNYARKEGFKVSDKHKDFKIKKETLEVIALTNDEFKLLLEA